MDLFTTVGDKDADALIAQVSCRQLHCFRDTNTTIQHLKRQEYVHEILCVQQGGLPDVVSQLLSEAAPQGVPAATAFAPGSEAVDFSELDLSDEDDEDLPEIQDEEVTEGYGSLRS